LEKQILRFAQNDSEGIGLVDLHDIRYLRIGTPDLGSAVEFATKIVGLQLAGREGKAAYFRSDKTSVRGDTRDHTLAYFEGDPADHTIAFDLKRFRFVDGTEELADLDSRRNLLKLSPTEFEHLVKDLFAAMGAEAWRTVPSKDGGVDAAATSKNLFFGGVCLIQAKRCFTAASAIFPRATPESRISATSASGLPTRRATRLSGRASSTRAYPTGSATRRFCG